MSTTTTKRTYCCAECGRKLPHEQWVFSSHTGSRYCWPGQGCQTQAAIARKQRSRERLAARRAARPTTTTTRGETA